VTHDMKGGRRRGRFLMTGAALALAPFAFGAAMMTLVCSAQAAEDNTVTIVSWGGATQDLERTSVWTALPTALGQVSSNREKA
jgi:hypothetical protein